MISLIMVCSVCAAVDSIQCQEMTSHLLCPASQFTNSYQKEGQSAPECAKVGAIVCGTVHTKVVQCK